MAEPMPRTREPLPLTLAVPSGRTIVRQGDASAGLWTVESGVLSVGVVAPDGHALMLDVLGPGDAVGEPEGVISLVSVRALRPCRLRPVRADVAMRVLATRAQRVAALACELAWLDVAGRVERRLVEARAPRPRRNPDRHLALPGGSRLARGNVARIREPCAPCVTAHRPPPCGGTRPLRHELPEPSCRITRLHELQ